MTEELQREAETVAVIDDDYAMRLSCQQILRKMGFRVEVFDDGASGLEGVARLKPALAVVDLKMPGLGGMEVVTRIHELEPETIIVVITGFATIGTAVEAMKSGAYDFVPKPFSPDELRVIVNRGLERRRLRLDAQRHEREREFLRRRFVTFVSHQLRTPLVAVHQYLDVMKRLLPEGADSPAKRQEWLERCLVRTDEMQQLIRDWLMLAEAESGSLTRERVEVDVSAVLAAVADRLTPLASDADVVLTCTAALPLPVLGDAEALSLMFENLIVNAIKYNRPQGRVTVTAEDGGGEVVVSIADTGIGIPVEYRDTIFDEFVRVKGEGAKKTTGTGLGLPICKRIAGELGGKIELDSQEGVGSTFRVRLPFHAVPRPVQTAVAAGGEA